FANSLYSFTPLKHLIDTQLTDAVLEAVATVATTEGRQLWVGMVNLDTGAFCAWDLTRLAIQQAYPLYRQVVLASASAPVIAPPVDIAGALHADGGTRLQVFGESVLKPMVRGYHAALRVQRPGAIEGVPELTVYVVINGKIIVEKTCVANALLPIGTRTLSVILHEALLGNLFRLQETLQTPQSQATVRFQASWIPDDYCLDFDSFTFDTTKMQRLFAAGEAWGRQPAWQADITSTLGVSSSPCQCTNIP